MESLGVNILNSEEFCSDLIALFFNHIWECDDCYSMILGALVAFFVVIGLIYALISIVVGFFEKLFSKIFDRFRYKKLYDDLSFKHGELLGEIDELSQDLWSLEAQNESLMSQWHELNLKYDELQKEYYHTCN